MTIHTETALATLREELAKLQVEYQTQTDVTVRAGERLAALEKLIAAIKRMLEAFDDHERMS